MSRATITRDPSGYITDGRELVGYLFDTANGTVATRPDRVPIGTFATWKAARAAIHEADTTAGKSGACVGFDLPHAREASASTQDVTG